MRLAAIQFKARSDFEHGLGVLCALIREAGAEADLVVCPEMALRGYAFTDLVGVMAVAETSDGPTARALCAVARETQSWVVCGFPEREGDRVYNAALVIDPGGRVVWVYRKVLLFEADLAWACPGDRGYRVFDTVRGRFTVGICADLNADGFLKWCAESSVDVIAFPTNWVQDEGDMWLYWRHRLYAGWPEGLPVERVTNRAQVHAALVAANSYGQEGEYALQGLSAILDWTGVHSAAGPVGDAVVLSVR